MNFFGGAHGPPRSRSATSSSTAAGGGCCTASAARSRAAQVTGLLGPSGSGKTTLMRAIVGVQMVAGGTVTVLGDPAGSAALRRRVGYLTQAPSVYADLTVRENARYFAALHGRRPADADQAIADVGLADAAGQLVGTLSGGQRSRASLACALVGRAGAGRPRRADRRAGPGAAGRPVGDGSTRWPPPAPPCWCPAT